MNFMKKWRKQVERWLSRIALAGILVTAGSVLFFQAIHYSFHAQDSISLAGLAGDYDRANAKGEFHGLPVASAEVPSIDLATALSASQKRIEVDLAKQRLYAFEGDKKVYDFLISSGKWGRTPTGTFRIWGKFRYTKMSGGSKALHTYYYLPNVPYVMFFSNGEVAPARGFSLHGTYWHDNFGHPMSHGCVNMKTEEAALIYYWSQPTVGDKNSTRSSSEDQGTEIIIYGVAPQE
jgi:hypothetical protein